MVWDFPEPVAPQTNTCRFTDPAGTDSTPGRHLVPVQDLP